MNAVVVTLLKWGFGLGAVFVLSSQCRRPWGWLGRRFAAVMNLGHAPLTAWGLGPVTIAPESRILDIGCGGGATMRALAAEATAGRVDGVDYSAASVAVARATNADLIRSGRAEVQQASVSTLPFPDGTFDLVTAVETHYYWPHFASDLREVRRVIAPGGRFVIIAETYKGRRMDWLFRPVMRLLLRWPGPASSASRLTRNRRAAGCARSARSRTTAAGYLVPDRRVADPPATGQRKSLTLLRTVIRSLLPCKPQQPSVDLRWRRRISTLTDSQEPT
jgi:SAM-dependent methyltransferase